MSVKVTNEANDARLFPNSIESRQCLKFLRRCIQHRIVPNFIKRKRLHAICGVPEDSHRILDIEMKVLRACLRSKQDNLILNQLPTYLVRTGASLSGR
ncbi:hypothetical protein KIN20_009560 [Parelaphostrongylus tenuis]|uniref:Uncharacterized protein n=1 Tax=Parelaphostrongylus tenuis TaxID=148309 RepID=A0AAD5QLB2_PARTN|nr:hypothetical protein KIN20_009560 [Parelaphostrongylus tenuis]